MYIFDDLKRTFSGDYTPAAPQRPVLFGQETTEVVQDPLLKDLYFGSDQSPGFLNQLQQAGSRLIGQDVPLQQTAGLGNLERQALSQAQAGIGSYQPFLNQNQRLLNEAIAQSRRAESLQDPYLRGATGEIGQGLTSLLGSFSLTSFNVEGWGRQEWGNSGWGVEYSVGLTGLGITSSVGSVVAAQFITAELTAPSTLTASLGSLTSDQLTIVALTAPSQLTSELGDFDNAGTLVGWGRNGWGEEPWGDSFNKLVQPTGLSATASVGAIAPTEMAIGLSGLSVTASVGSIVPAIGVPLTGVDATSSVGSLVIAEGVPLTGIGATASVGAIAPADVIGLTGVGATTGIGEITVTETQLVLPSGVSATASVGAISPTNMSIGLSGLGMTASQGAIVPASAVGLTAPDALTASVGNVAPLGYSRITGTQSAGYSDVTGTQTAGYTSVTSS